MGSQFLAKARETIRRIESQRNEPYVDWKDMDDGGIALMYIGERTFGEKPHYKDPKMTFPYMGVMCVKVWDSNDRITRCWNLWDHDLDAQQIRISCNAWMQREIEQSMAPVLMMSGHEYVSKPKSGGKPFHSMRLEFFEEDSEAYALLFEPHPMVGRS